MHDDDVLSRDRREIGYGSLEEIRPVLERLSANTPEPRPHSVCIEPFLSLDGTTATLDLRVAEIWPSEDDDEALVRVADTLVLTHPDRRSQQIEDDAATHWWRGHFGARPLPDGFPPLSRETERLLAWRRGEDQSITGEPGASEAAAVGSPPAASPPAVVPCKTAANEAHATASQRIRREAGDASTLLAAALDTLSVSGQWWGVSPASLPRNESRPMAASPTPPDTLEVFYSYAHEDEPLLGELRKHLGILKRQGVIRDWHDRKITAGTEWKGQIDHHLTTAGVILLLVSADFIASDYCYDIEMTRALERHKQREARVIPVILRPVDDWQSAPFGKLQALPRDGKPVTTWGNRDEAFADVARGIREAAQSLAAGAPNHSAPAPPAEVLTPPPTARPRAVDRAALVRTVSGLSPGDMALLVTLVDGAASHVSRHGTVREQASELIGWAESSTGPGLVAVQEALDSFR